MKQAIIQQAVPGVTGNQDFTDAIFSSDVKAAIFLMSSATATHTNTADFRTAIGLLDGTNQSVAAIYGQDATVGASNWRRNHNAANCVGQTADSSTFTVLGAGSFISNGARVNYSAVTGSALVTCILIGGSDVTAAKLSCDFTGGGAETKTVNHGGSSAPTAIIAVSHYGTSASTTTRGSIGMGFYANGLYGSNNLDRLDAQATEQAQGWVATDLVLRDIGSSYGVTISNVGSTSFDVTTSADATTDRVDFLAIWITNGAAKAGTFTTNTTTGSHVAVSGMSKKPSVLLTLPSRQTATGLDNTDGGGVFGVGAAVNNNGTTQYGLVVGSSDDAAATQVNKSQASNSQMVRILNVSGAAIVGETVQSWDNGGVTANAATADGTAHLIPYLAMGNGSGGGAGLLLGVG